MIKTPLCIPILWWLHLVGAQCGGAPSETAGTTASPTTSASASVATQMVDVGEHGFVFNPDTIHVASGGKVEFKFYPGNHSVAQAAFNNPCHPISDTSFFSGFMPSANDGSSVWTLTVNDTNPIWFYCGQIGHCQAGMVGVINPSGSDTLDAFKSAASSASGDSVPATAQGGILGTTSSSQSTATSGSTAPTSGTATTSSAGTTSSTATASGSPTSTGNSSPSATNMAEKLQISTDLHVLSILTFIVAMFLM